MALESSDTYNKIGIVMYIFSHDVFLEPCAKLY